MSLSTLGARVAIAGATFALAAAGGAQGATTTARAAAVHRAVIHGTVVHVDHRARSFVVATGSGRLYAIHAARSPRTARAVTVEIRPLRNGTFAAGWVHLGRIERHARARLHGVVTYIDARHGTFVLSARGVSMLVHTAGSPARVAHAARALPPLATVVTAIANVGDRGEVSEQSLQIDGTDTGAVDLEGTVQAVNTTAGTLTLSSDDDEEGAGTITVNVPAGFDIAAFSIGQDVELTATVNPDRTYTLIGAADDRGAQGADDQGEQQGEQGDSDELGAVDLEGTVQAVNTTAGTLTLSSNDDDESTATITVHVPATLDIAAFSVGQDVELTATVNAGGSYTLNGPADGNDDTQGSDESQGDSQDQQQQDDSASDSTHESRTTIALAARV